MDFRVFEATPGIAVILKPDAPVYTQIAVSNDLLTDSGMKKEDVIGRGHFEVFPPNPDDPNFTGEINLKKSFEYILQHKVAHDIPLQRYDIPVGDGTFTERYWKVKNAPLLNEKGDVEYIIHTATDITDQIVAEQKVESTRGIEKAYNFFMNAPVIIGFVKGDNYIIDLANEGLLQVWAKDSSVIGKSLIEAMPELKEQGFTDLLDNVRITGEPFYAYEYPITLNRHGKDEVLYFDFVYKPYYENTNDKKATGVISVGYEVTDRIISRQKIEESSQELKFVTDFMPQIIWSTKPDGYHEFYNKRWFDYTGLTYEESKDTGWNTVLHPDDQQRAWEVWRHSLNTGDPYEIEYRFKRFDGEYRWFLGRALPLRDETGKITKWYGSCTDIDDQKKASDLLEQKVSERTLELENQKNELKRSNSNLEEFAYAASHDLKEPIRKIRTYSEMLKNKLKDRLLEEDKDFFSRMENAGNRMQLLIDDLLEYSHISSPEALKEDIDLNKKVALVLEDLELFVSEKKANVIVEKLPLINGYRRQIQQLIQNLLSNALKFSKPEENPVIKIYSKEVSGESITSYKDDSFLSGKSFHMIVVEDNGIGFEQQYADKIFQMFQRLHGKQEYVGTGIGLAIVRRVVENHNGYVQVQSQPGVGSTFKIYLPIEK